MAEFTGSFNAKIRRLLNRKETIYGEVFEKISPYLESFESGISKPSSAILATRAD